MARTFSLTLRAFMSAAPLAQVAARLPPVPTTLKGVSRVSPWTTRTWSIATPISSATTWARVVSWPWPCGDWAVITVT